MSHVPKILSSPEPENVSGSVLLQETAKAADNATAIKISLFIFFLFVWAKITQALPFPAYQIG